MAGLMLFEPDEVAAHHDQRQQTQRRQAERRQVVQHVATAQRVGKTDERTFRQELPDHCRKENLLG